MREIKFIAWDKKNNKIVFPNQFYHNNGKEIYEGYKLKAPDGTLYKVFWHDTRAMFALEPIDDKKSKYIEPWDDWDLYEVVNENCNHTWRESFLYRYCALCGKEQKIDVEWLYEYLSELLQRWEWKKDYPSYKQDYERLKGIVKDLKEILKTEKE